jgi:hypothetical protein
MKRSYILLSLGAAAVAVMIVLGGAVTNVTSRPSPIGFEQEAREIAAGRSPRFLVRQAQGLYMAFVRPSEDGRGQDLYFQVSTDAGDSFDEPMRVNDVSGEVADHGENSPVLVSSPDNRYFYAAWCGRDPKNPGGTVIRFSRTSSMRPSFTPAITVNDDNLPVSHSFHTAGVGPDGTIYVAWLDGRDRVAHGGAHAAHGGGEGGSSIYLARSTYNGQTFSKNVRVATNICPCCRLTIAFAGNRVLLGWRQIEPGDVRDIFVASSSDQGETWEEPALVARDGWKIAGCPHVGPALVTVGDRLYAAWFTEGGGDPAINLAYSTDGGKTFIGKQKVSAGTTDPTHPQMVSNGEKAALIFQGRGADRDQGWGRVGVYYREIYRDGSLSNLIRLPEGEANANYPTVKLGLSGRIFVGWTQAAQGRQTVHLVRGRAETSQALGEE